MSNNLQSIKQRFGIIGHSPALERALETAVRVAPTDLTVLITGESGVGKEVFSKIIHSLSPRKHNKFIAVNCGAIPAGTINSELFGHAKGAFTSATSDRKGYFETVDGGTIFLDEIGEMPLDTQTFLLRVLETGDFLRVGSSKTLKTNVRVIAATNADLQDGISNGKFREDLYYRLNTIMIKVPALRERREDIYLLFRKFAADFAEKYRRTPVQLDANARTLLENYAWPGNIRQLKNIAEQISVLAQDQQITTDELLEFIPKANKRNLPVLAGKGDTTAGLEEREILYKLLFDMKKDLNDLKSLVFELIRTNNLSLPDVRKLNRLDEALPQPEATQPYDLRHEAFSADLPTVTNHDQPIIIESTTAYTNKASQEVEETLSLIDMEKDLIKRALKKHKGKRKDAAAELGISERTLYRKIKYYNIKE